MEYDVAVDANTHVIDELNHVPIKVVNGATIYMSDVAQIHDGYTPQQNAVRQDGVRGALLTIMKAGDASTLDVVAGVKAALPGVMATVSPDLTCMSKNLPINPCLCAQPSAAFCAKV